VRNSHKGGPHGIPKTGEPDATASFASSNIYPDYMYRGLSPRSHYFVEIFISNYRIYSIVSRGL